MPKSKKRKPNHKGNPNNRPQKQVFQLKLPKGGAMVKTLLLSVCWVLNDAFGFGPVRLTKFIQKFFEFWVVTHRNNDTVLDELEYWAEKEGIKV